jgi:hypothetical protein
MTRTLPRFLLTAALTLAAGGMAASPALAHVQLESTTPKAHSSTKKTLRAVRMTFSGPIRSGRLTVKGPHGKTASKGHGGRDPRNIDRLLVSLRSGLKAGKYTARASVVAADGHHETFSFWFRLK